MEKELNVIEVACDNKRGMILGEYESMKSGESFVLINDTDPQPLINKLSEMYPDVFKYEYLESGPTNWKLRFSKLQKVSCCGCC